MSVLAVLDAERIKLATIRSPLWSVLLAAAASLSVAVLQGIDAYATEPLSPESAAVGVAMLGVPVLTILSALLVTGEYRTGMIRTTFAATPNRTQVLVAKAAVAAAFASVIAVVLVVGSIAVARLAADPMAASAQLSLGAPRVWVVAGSVALYAALTAILGVAVGALLRHTAGALATLLLWPLVVEPLVANLPRLGDAVGPFLPFVNAFATLDLRWLFPVYSMPWGHLGSLIYFGVVVAVVFVGAAMVVNRRDA